MTNCFNVCEYYDLGCADSGCERITLPIRVPFGGKMLLVGDSQGHMFNAEVVVWVGDKLEMKNIFNEYSTLIFALYYQNLSKFVLEKDGKCYEYFKIRLEPQTRIRDTDTVGQGDLTEGCGAEFKTC